MMTLLKRFVCLALLLLVAHTVQAQRQTLYVLPQTTDPAIDNWTERHFVAINPATTLRNQLLLWLPGTGGLPLNYKLITEHAADLGYHAIGLRYPNDEAVGLLCAPEDDLGCFGSVRQEILDGEDRSSLVAVNATNSIENRLLKLLIYLNDIRASENWAQFFDGDGLRWDRIAVAGHSQGGGHAGFIASIHRVARVVMFASADFDASLRTPAAWYDADNPTPPSAYFGFGHTGDLLVFRNRVEAAWEALGMNTFGPSINVDGREAPFDRTHSLLTSAASALPALTGTHNSVAVDLYTPKRADGTPLHAPVWTYLFIADATNVGNEDPAPPTGYHFAPSHPNPFRQSTTLRFSLSAPQFVSLTVFDLLGREVRRLVEDYRAAGSHLITFDAARLPPGIYLAHIVAGPFSETQRLVVIR